MAFSLKALSIIVLAFAVFVQGTLGGIACEDLNKDNCAFAVSSSGKRCVLEKQVSRSGLDKYTCHSSEIEADIVLKDWIESDECIEACGVDRKSLGISSDSFLEPCFTHKLCSPQCYNSCPNIVDLYFNLAAGEGVFLPKLCKSSQGENARRGLSEIKSSGLVAEGPGSAIPLLAAEGPESAIPSANFAVAPALAPY